MTMPLDRRDFLAASGSALATLGLARHVAARPAERSSSLFTYAVNVEMFWTGLPFIERLHKVKESGFTHYEFWPWLNKDIDAIARTNAALGLTPVQFSASPRSFNQGITDPKRKEEFVEDIRAAVSVAKRLGVKMLCVVAGEETEGLDRDRQTAAVVDAFKAAVPTVEKEGITLILEPLNVLVDHPRQLVVKSEHAAQIIQAVGSPYVKILFDIYHQQISEGNLSGNIRRYSDMIGYYQLADHPGRYQPGTGEIRYAHVLMTIHATGYRGPIGLEMRPGGGEAKALEAIRLVDQEALGLVP
jgi:hydroxypyruvate isomerase